MKILILDDDMNRHMGFAKMYPDATHVRTYRECVDALEQNEPFDLVYLDHDLADFGTPDFSYGHVHEYTGADVAWYIARSLIESRRPGKVIVHSWNPAGAQRMLKLLQGAGISCVYQPYNEAAAS